MPESQTESFSAWDYLRVLQIVRVLNRFFFRIFYQTCVAAERVCDDDFFLLFLHGIHLLS